MRNLHELNANLDVLLLPWDGRVTQLVGSQLPNSTIVSLVPAHSVMAEFSSYLQAKRQGTPSSDMYDDPLAWQVMKVMYGVLVLNDSSIDDVTARDGLALSRPNLNFKVDRFNVEQRLWEKLGVYADGDFSWPKTTTLQVGKYLL